MLLNNLIVLLLIIGFCLFIYGYTNKGTKTKAKICPDQVPYKMHGINVRSRLSDNQWNDLRNYVKKRKGFKCEVCGMSGKKQGFRHDVECHEEWEHDPTTRTQKLTNLLVLCPLCHKYKHIGLADNQGYGTLVRKHIAKVNEWTSDEVEVAINKNKSEVRNLKGAWKLDLTYLNTYNYKIPGITFTEQENHLCRKEVYE
jgi:5-methylcytosine-specific restriction endonuclease McrA